MIIFFIFIALMDISTRRRKLAWTLIWRVMLLIGLIEVRTHINSSKVHCLIYKCVAVLLPRNLLVLSIEILNYLNKNKSYLTHFGTEYLWRESWLLHINWVSSSVIFEKCRSRVRCLLLTYPVIDFGNILDIISFYMFHLS